MRNKIFYIVFLLIWSNHLLAEQLEIQSKNISLDNINKISIFEGQVLVKTQDGYFINSDYAKYDKEKGVIELKNNVVAKDKKNNIIKSNYANYNEKTKILKTKGTTTITTSENYLIKSKNILVDDNIKLIQSNEETIIEDIDKNKIFLDNFEYLVNDNIFKSVGFVNVLDNLDNSYKFSQIYIDTNKKEILGTDIKANLNSQEFKVNKNNKPRVLANTVKIDKEKNTFNKSIFTLCDYRSKDKCPPWTIQSTKMLHDKKKNNFLW